MTLIKRQAEWIQVAARFKPVGYFRDRLCKRVEEHSTENVWAYTRADDDEIERKYQRYVISTADLPQERISGCCDRADQY